MAVFCSRLKQDLETIKTLKLELDLELPKLEELFKVFKNNNPSTSLRVFNDKSKAEFRKDRTELINKIKSIEAEINSIVVLMESLLPISAFSPEGVEIKIRLAEQLKYWSNFYENNGVDWVSLPETIDVSKEQKKEMQRLITEFGFNEILIIPENLAANGDDYEKLLALMTKGYDEKIPHNQTLRFEDFKWGDDFYGLKNKSNKLRIILTKKIKNIADDKLFLETEGKSIVDLKRQGGVLTKNKLKGFDLGSYLVFQFKYFQETGKHLDGGSWIWLTEQSNFSSSGYMPTVNWNRAHECLVLSSRQPDTADKLLSGCRLAGIFEIV
jgi:hypothetical protein